MQTGFARTPSFLNMTYSDGSLEEKDIGTFKELFDTYYDEIVNFMYYKSGDIETSEDIAQEVFLKVWDNRKNVKKESVQGYLYTIASNLLKNHYKRNSIAFNFSISLGNNPTSESPDYILEMKEFDKEIQEVLASMPEKSRIVFLLNRIDGLIYKDIATRLHISIKAVEKRMQKALRYWNMHTNYKV